MTTFSQIRIHTLEERQAHHTTPVMGKKETGYQENSSGGEVRPLQLTGAEKRGLFPLLNITNVSFNLDDLRRG